MMAKNGAMERMHLLEDLFAREDADFSIELWPIIKRKNGRT